MKRKLIALVLAFTFVLSLFTIEGFASTNVKEKDSNKTKAEKKVTLAESENSEGTITRAEWIHELVEIFDLSIDKDEYPDNYYSDITEEDDCYADVMAATMDGMLRIEAGDPFEPDKFLTREFAAYTLNYELGIENDSDKYTFTDVDEVLFPEDVQVALNQNWFVLSDGKFVPGKSVSEDEYNGLLTVARKIINDRSVEQAKANYRFADYVIELPEDAEIEAQMDMDSNQMTMLITGYNGSLEEGDTFVYFSEGMAFVYSVASVSKDDDVLTVITKDAPEDAIQQYEFVGELTPEITPMLPEDNEEVVMMASDGEEVVFEKVELAGVSVKNDTIEYSRTFRKGKITGTLNTTISNIRPKYNLVDKTKFFSVSGNISIKSDVKLDLLNDSAASHLSLGGASLGPLGYVGVELQLDMHASIGYFYKASFEIGAQKTGKTISSIKKLNTKESGISVDGTVSAELALTARVDVPGILDANASLKTGPVITAYYKRYQQGQPTWCMTMAGYLHAGFSASVTFIGFVTKSFNYSFYNENNSPIRVYVHVEDYKQVARCSRPNDPGVLDKGYRVPRYLTKAGSRFYGGWSNVPGEWDGSSEPVVIWETEENGDGTVTITGYHGNASVLNIPETIDDKTVTALGGHVFENNTRLRIVTMPDTITEIQDCVFAGCSNLSSINFSKNLVAIWTYAFASTAIEEANLPEGLKSLGNDFDGAVFYDCKNLKTVHIPSTLEVSGAVMGGLVRGCFGGCSSLTNVTFGENIKTIPNNLFLNCDGLKSVSIPDTVTSIGTHAFENCTSLSSVIIGSHVSAIDEYAFANSALEKVTLPEGLLSLGDWNGGAFSECKQLQSVYIPSTLEVSSKNGYVGNFSGCSNLNNVIFGERIKIIPSYLFKDCDGLKHITLPDTVTCINPQAFYNCINLKNVEFDESLTEIDEYAFVNTALEKVTLPEGLLSLGDWNGGVFSECKQLQSVYIPSTLEVSSKNGYIGNFSGCSSLSQIEFGEGISQIPDYLFKGCDGLNSVVIPSSIETIGHQAFLGSSIQKITIPDAVTSYGSYALADCANLTSVELSNNANDIPEGMFKGCSTLETIALPEGVEMIKQYTFSECDKLKSVTLPVGIIEIENEAFRGCSSLKNVDFLPYTLNKIGTSAFKSCDSLETADIPDLVTEIGAYSFADCGNLTKVILSADLKSIEWNAFENDVKLSDVYFNDGLRSIDREAFNNCGLTSITLPDSVISLGESVFANNSDLTSVTLSKNLKEIPNYAFSECDNKKFTSLTIPAICET